MLVSFFVNSCFLHDGQFYVSLGFAPIILLTVFSIVITVKAKMPCRRASRRAGRKNRRHDKPLRTIACLLYMAGTWSLCLLFLVLDDSSLAIVFAVFNIFQGPIVLPFLVRVIGNNLKNAANADMELNEIAMSEQTQLRPVKV